MAIWDAMFASTAHFPVLSSILPTILYKEC
jgi:hypothetical protein